MLLLLLMIGICGKCSTFFLYKVYFCPFFFKKCVLMAHLSPKWGVLLTIERMCRSRCGNGISTPFSLKVR